MASTILSGTAFGAALLIAGVAQPSVIINQLKFADFHMIQAFLAAAAGSTVLVAILGRLGRIPLKPRSPSSLGLFAPYDGNLIGGALLGAGMALAGACPGTVFAQIGAGHRSGFYALDGSVLAGIAYVGYLGPWVSRRQAAAADGNPSKVTVYEQLGISRDTAVAGFLAVCAAVISVSALYGGSGLSAAVYPVIGGLIIALAQLVSATSRSCLVGTSTSFEEMGKYAWWLFRGADSGKNPRSYSSLLFTGSMAAGAYAVSQLAPGVFSSASDIQISPALGTVGGFLMVIGSRVAGGCTSGHGVTGISLLSMSSFITIGTAFAVGGLVAPLVY